MPRDALLLDRPVDPLLRRQRRRVLLVALVLFFTPVVAVLVVLVRGDGGAGVAGTQILGNKQPWADRFAQQKKEVAENKPECVLLGDSNMERWPLYGQPEYDARYGKLNLLNLGISGDTTANVLYRVTHGLFAGHAPRRVVLMIGTNDLDPDDALSNDQVADGVKDLVTTLRARLPDAEVLVLGVLPRTSPEMIARVRAVNARLGVTLAGLPGVTFVDASARFLTGRGTLRKPYYGKDHGHLTQAGYVELADVLDEAWAKP